MAHKRMFSRDIVQSDAFLDMPSSTQALYFQLGMEADDDGFVGNPKKVVRILGTNEDDLKLLIAKRFVLLFQSGVLVIKHHRINNNWDKYNCKRTVYLEEFSQLYIKENKAYTLDKMKSVPQSKNRLKTVFRIEENRIEEKRRDKSSKTEVLQGNQWNDLIDSFKEINPSYTEFYSNKTERAALEKMVTMWGYEKTLHTIQELPKITGQPYAPKITKPSELKRDIGKLLAFHKQSSSKKKTMV